MKIEKKKEKQHNEGNSHRVQRNNHTHKKTSRQKQSEFFLGAKTEQTFRFSRQ